METEYELQSAVAVGNLRHFHIKKRYVTTMKQEKLQSCFVTRVRFLFNRFKLHAHILITLPRHKKGEIKKCRYEIFDLSQHFYIILTVCLENNDCGHRREKKNSISCRNNCVNKANHFTWRQTFRNHYDACSGVFWRRMQGEKTNITFHPALSWRANIHTWVRKIKWACCCWEKALKNPFQPLNLATG